MTSRPRTCENSRSEVELPIVNTREKSRSTAWYIRATCCRPFMRYNLKTLVLPRLTIYRYKPTSFHSRVASHTRSTPPNLCYSVLVACRPSIDAHLAKSSDGPFSLLKSGLSTNATFLRMHREKPSHDSKGHRINDHMISHRQMSNPLGFRYETGVRLWRRGNTGGTDLIPYKYHTDLQVLRAVSLPPSPLTCYGLTRHLAG